MSYTISKVESTETEFVLDREHDVRDSAIKITVFFDKDEDSPVGHSVESVLLRNERGEELKPYSKGKMKQRIIGTNAVEIPFYFEPDEIVLVDGATFEIVTYDWGAEWAIKSTFCYNGSEWMLKDRKRKKAYTAHSQRP